MRWRLDIAYDGAAFSGWATQPERRTVQGELEHWITRVLRLDRPVELTCAGRTDAGVHARGQVAHVDLPDDLALDTLLRRVSPDETLGSLLLRRLARALPDDVVVRAVTPAPAGFDARFSAEWRRYRYLIADAGGPRDPLTRGHVVWWPEPLDIAAMNDAASGLLGLHDFAAFCKRREGATTIRTLLDLRCERRADGVIDTTVRADAFCHSMVRSLMGGLVAVGSGARDATWLAGLVTRPNREPSIRVMSAHGLVLEEVRYPDAEHLAARATATRATRCLTEDC